MLIEPGSFFCIDQSPLDSCWAVASQDLTWFNGRRGDKRSSNVFPLPRGEAIQMFDEIAHQMKAISHLDCLGKRLSNSCRKFFRTIPRNQLNRGMLAQPSSDNGTGSLFKQGNWAMTFEVDHNGSIAGPFLPRPIIQSNHPWRLGLSYRLGMKHSQECATWSVAPSLRLCELSPPLQIHRLVHKAMSEDLYWTVHEER